MIRQNEEKNVSKARQVKKKKKSGSILFPKEEIACHPCELAKEVAQKEKAWKIIWEGCSTGCKATSQSRECSLLRDACCGVQHLLTFPIVKTKQNKTSFLCVSTFCFINLKYHFWVFLWWGEKRRSFHSYLFFDCCCDSLSCL